MQASKQTPETLAAPGVREIDQAQQRVDREISQFILDRQARQLTRRCAISAAMAAIVAPLVFGEARQ